MRRSKWTHTESGFRTVLSVEGATRTEEDTPNESPHFWKEILRGSVCVYARRKFLQIAQSHLQASVTRAHERTRARTHSASTIFGKIMHTLMTNMRAVALQITIFQASLCAHRSYAVYQEQTFRRYLDKASSIVNTQKIALITQQSCTQGFDTCPSGYMSMQADKIWSVRAEHRERKIFQTGQYCCTDFMSP